MDEPERHYTKLKKKKISYGGVPTVVQWKGIQLITMKLQGSIPGFTQWVKNPVYACGVGGRRGSDPELLWHRPAAAALIRSLAWKPSYATGAALKKKKKKKEKKISYGRRNVA